MRTCSSCGTEFALQVCPACGGSAALTQRQINKRLVKYSYPALGGLLGIVIANFWYPMLDRDPFLIAAVVFFAVPGLFHVVSSFRRRLALDAAHLQRGYLYAGCASIVVALLMAGNGAFDHSLAVPVRTSLIYKQVVRGRSGTSYMLRVRSWRAGRATEDLGVNGRTYRSVSTTKGVVVELHRGAFGLPWYSGVFPE